LTFTYIIKYMRSLTYSSHMVVLTHLLIASDRAHSLTHRIWSCLLTYSSHLIVKCVSKWQST